MSSGKPTDAAGGTRREKQPGVYYIDKSWRHSHWRCPDCRQHPLVDIHGTPYDCDGWPGTQHPPARPVDAERKNRL